MMALITAIEPRSPGRRPWLDYRLLTAAAALTWPGLAALT